MKVKFFLLSTLSFFVCILGGFYTGARFAYNLFYSMANDPYGEEALGFFPYAILFSLIGLILGFVTSLIIIHKLGKRWGNNLNFGGHPAIKLTGLSFLTFLGILVALLFLMPTK